MDQAILALLGVIITLMLYFDRGRRADIALLRQETNQGLAELREEMTRGFAYVHERIDKLTEVVMDLVSRVS
ncbi:MAG: hypothetical protein OXN95_00050, partial [bacterium]|nr:hypothetical protein [bacterium]